MIITVVLVVLALAVVGYVLASRIAGQPVNTRRLLVLPGVLTAMGLLQLSGAVSGGVRPPDLGLLAVGVAAAAGLGAARGATVTVAVRDGRPWLRYRPVTLGLWAVGGDGRGAGRADRPRARCRRHGRRQRPRAAAVRRSHPARRRRHRGPPSLHHRRPTVASSGDRTARRAALRNHRC